MANPRSTRWTKTSDQGTRPSALPRPARLNAAGLGRTCGAAPSLESRGFAWLRWLALLAVGLGLLSLTGLAGGGRNSAVDVPPAAKPISEVRLGERVLGQNPELSGKDVALPEPRPDTWRRVRLQLQATNSPQVDVELLRPLSWLEAVGARAGGTIHLDLPELGAAGPATVLSIEPCPTLMPGRGNLVTGRFVHRPSGDLLELYVRGEPSPLRVTPNHPIWSVDRVEFVTAGELRQGEVLLTRHRGQVQVERIVRRACHEPVYNLEVFGQHVYEVGTTGLLVHNSYGCGQDPVNPPHEPKPTDPVKAPVAGTSAPEPPAGSVAEARTTAPSAMARGPVPLKDLNYHISDFVRTDSMTPKQLARLVADIKQNGLQNPVIEYVEIAGKPFVLRGNNRLMAAKQLPAIRDQLRFQRVELPFGGYSHPDGVVEAAVEATGRNPF